MGLRQNGALTTRLSKREHAPDMSEWTSIVDDLVAHLRWRRECDVRTEEMDAATLRAFLADAPAQAPRLPSAQPATPGATVSRPPLPAPPPGDRAPRAAPNDTPEARQESLAKVAREVAACRKCALHQNRTRTVPGQGNSHSPDVMFVGEAPGADEDQQGLAFVGAAGQLLTRMIVAMGYSREEVFIGNICKCRPPNNRQPDGEEMQACLPYLRQQIAAVRPRIIVALGATAVKGLLHSTVGISRLRGTWTAYDGIPLMPTYHPAYLLRYPPAKKAAWDDLKQVLARLGRPVPPKSTRGDAS
jgi:DNA polymerase